MSAAWRRYGWAMGWSLLVGASLWLRDPLPVDEVRYLGVAWEMWLRGDFLVPYLNGEPYSHKPPLLFWLFHGGWYVFGVNEWWPRLVPALFALGSLFGARALARRLWPDAPQSTTLVPWLLAGGIFWSLYTPFIFFDMLLTAWVVLAILALLLISRGRVLGALVMLAAATGAGLLTKGPVMLVHVIFPLLLAPWWSRDVRLRPARWYLLTLSAVGVGIAIALWWALPAAEAGGARYAGEILWDQTRDRLTESFAHQRPAWWYLPVLPLLWLPWVVWTPLWQASAAVLRRPDDGLRMCLSWAVPVFLVLSLVSGKQPQYLLPIFPALALIFSRALVVETANRRSLILPALVLLLGAGALFAATRMGWAGQETNLWWLALFVFAAPALLWNKTLCRDGAVRRLAFSSFAAAVAIVGFAAPELRAGQNVKAPAALIAGLQKGNTPIAHVTRYRDEFHFAGRLTQALEVIRPRQLWRWMKDHPRGVVVIKPDRAPGPRAPAPLYGQRYRGGWLTLWPVATIEGHCRRPVFADNQELCLKGFLKGPGEETP